MKKLLQRKIFPLRRKLIIYFFLFFLLVLITGIYINIGYRVLFQFFQDLLYQNQQLERLSTKLQALQFYNETYLSNNLYKDLNKFYENYEQIKELNYEISSNFKTGNYPELNIIIETILTEAERVIIAKTNNEPIYYQYYTQFVQDLELGQKYIVKLINHNNKTGNNRYTLSMQYLKNIERKAILLTIFSGILTILSLLYFSLNITKPLEKIMHNAQKISNGNFNVTPITVKTNDELKMIAMVFNQMTEDINNLFQEIKGKIKLERELQQEKVENFKINTLLHEAEIKKLQAQINPHFLYNTLNTISQVAILEEADQTGDLIKEIAKLLRYNLKQSNILIPIGEELENIKIYCHIMEVRYDDKIKFKLDYPEKIDHYYIPCMTIQPLIENALIHGIDKDGYKQGLINIKLQEINNYLQIKIRDNGKGIPQQKIKEIMEINPNHNSISGLHNIKERLELSFKRDKLFQIKSIPEKGTEIIIRIPSFKGSD